MAKLLTLEDVERACSVTYRDVRLSTTVTVLRHGGGPQTMCPLGVAFRGAAGPVPTSADVADYLETIGRITASEWEPARKSLIGFTGAWDAGRISDAQLYQTLIALEV